MLVSLWYKGSSYICSLLAFITLQTHACSPNSGDSVFTKACEDIKHASFYLEKPRVGRYKSTNISSSGTKFYYVVDVPKSLYTL